MALPNEVGDREQQKFVEADDGSVAVRIQPSNIGGLLVANTTTTPLAGDATYTGTWTDVSQYTSAVVACLTDAAGILYVEFSDDGSGDAEQNFEYHVRADTSEEHRHTVTRRYLRVRYVNGSDAQTTFGLSTIMGSHTALSVPLDGALSHDADSTPVRAIPMEHDIVRGKRSEYLLIRQFGRNSDIDNGTTPEDIWDGGGLYTGIPTGAAETVEVFSSNANDTDGGSGAEVVRISGLDANYDIQTEDITLNGTTAVTTTTTWTRCNLVVVQQSNNGANDGVNAGTITVRHSTTTANVFAVMQAGRNHSEVAVITVPRGYTAYIQNYSMRVKKSNTIVVDGVLYCRPFGKPELLVQNFTAVQANDGLVTFYGGMVIGEKADIFVRVTSVNGATNVDASSDIEVIYILDDPV